MAAWIWQWRACILGVPIGVSDNFASFAWREFFQKELMKLVVIHFRCEISNKNWVFWAEEKVKKKPQLVDIAFNK